MATPRKLVLTMAEALGLPEPTVTQYDRQLSESGLRSKSGRGPSAAKVTARDAANLLISILGSPVAGASIKAAAATCAIYGELVERSNVAVRDPFRKLGLPSLGDLPPSHSLLEALTTIIASAARGETFNITFQRETRVADFAFGLTVTGPDPWAEIVADGSFGGVRRNYTARFVYSAQRKSNADPTSQGDLTQSRAITFATLRKLGAIVVEGEPQSQRTHDVADKPIAKTRLAETGHDG
jgi:hypothetical protein